MKEIIKVHHYIVFIAALSICFVSCSTSKISMNKAEMTKISTIAIMDFDSSAGIPKTIVTECEEAFRGHFIDAGIKVVERAKLKSIIDEIEKSQAGLVNNSEEIGRLSGAQALLFATVTRNDEKVKWVEYYERKKNPETGKKEKIKKRKRKKFFSFQIQARLVSTSNGSTILTIKNKNPERSYDMTNRITLSRFRENILNQMGRDLNKAFEEED